MFAKWNESFKQAQQEEKEAKEALLEVVPNMVQTFMVFFQDVCKQANIFKQAKKHTVEIANQGLHQAIENVEKLLQNKWDLLQDYEMIEMNLKNLYQINSNQVRVHDICFVLEYLKDQTLEAFKQSCDKIRQADDELVKVKKAVDDWSSSYS